MYCPRRIGRNNLPCHIMNLIPIKFISPPIRDCIPTTVYMIFRPRRLQIFLVNKKFQPAALRLYDFWSPKMAVIFGDWKVSTNSSPFIWHFERGYCSYFRWAKYFKQPLTVYTIFGPHRKVSTCCSPFIRFLVPEDCSYFRWAKYFNQPLTVYTIFGPHRWFYPSNNQNRSRSMHSFFVSSPDREGISALGRGRI